MLGYAADAYVGDPRRHHPVALFGSRARSLELRLWRDSRPRGALFTTVCAGGLVAAAVAADRVTRRHPLPHTALTALTTWAVLGGTSLCREAQAVGAALQAGDVDAARRLLPNLCGRDPAQLDEEEIARAVVESVAENTADAVSGALVWGAVAGVPGLVGYRAVNTLDAMVGHRGARYERFGWASARLDDVAGWPGARLTALAAAAGSGTASARRQSLRVCRRDGPHHPSPNAGRAESSFAGALGVRLGGSLTYGGRAEHRPELGSEFRAAGPVDIPHAVRLSQRVGAAVWAASAVLAALRPAWVAATRRRCAR